MPGRDYIVLVRRPGEAAGGPFAAAAARLREEAAWTLRYDHPTLSAWSVGDELPVRALRQDAGIVIGQLHAAPGIPRDASPLVEGREPLGAPDDVAQRLLQAHWGRYVAVIRDDRGAAVLRDPSGDLDACVWTTREGVGVVASDLSRVPGWLRPQRVGLRWDRIALCLAAPGGATATSLLDDVEIVAPGGLRPVLDGAGPSLAWDIPALCAPAPLDPIAARAQLLETVDRCTSGSVVGYDRLLVDLSGGLDSSVVAGAIAHAGLTSRVTQWVHRLDDRPEGDERAYARAVTDRLGGELTVVRKPLTPLTPEDFAELADGFWPGLNGADAARDRDIAGRLAHADAIVSGQGGDAVFYQMPTPWVASETVRRRGLAALAAPVLVDTARRLRKPVWTVYREARAGLRPGRGLPPVASTLLTAAAREAAVHAVHPWEAAARGLPLARQLQVCALANAHVVRGDSRRRRRGDLVFPLATQPLVELCLSIPVEVLVGGVQDRPFAREALAPRIPDVIRHRRSKGSLTAYFSRLVAASRETLLPFLRDGCLAEAGLLDPAAVERAFDPDLLIWNGRPNDVLNAAPVEAWVRHWQGRVPDAARSPRRG